MWRSGVIWLFVFLCVSPVGLYGETLVRGAIRCSGSGSRDLGVGGSTRGRWMAGCGGSEELGAGKGNEKEGRERGGEWVAE